MRSFVAGLAVFLAFLTGTAGLASYVVHDVVLDPSRAGEVVDYALHQPDTRREILGRTVPGYGRLPVRVRAAVDALADSPRLRSPRFDGRTGSPGRREWTISLAGTRLSEHPIHR